MEVSIGDRVWTANKKYLDGTRLRASPQRDDFNGQSVLNDVQVVVV
eukprot:SAG11_NODE_24075_length_378_cov_1.189964_1_plen_45_part_10